MSKDGGPKHGHILTAGRPIVTRIWHQIRLCKGHNIERSRALVKMNSIIGFLGHKNIDLDTNMIIQLGLVRKLWQKMCFCKMIANLRHCRTSHVQSAQDIFNSFKDPYPSYQSCVKIWQYFCPVLTTIWPRM